MHAALEAQYACLSAALKCVLAIAFPLAVWFARSKLIRSLHPTHHSHNKTAILAICRFKLLYIPSSGYHTGGGITDDVNNAVVANSHKIVRHVNDGGGSLIALTQVRHQLACVTPV